MPAGAAMVPQAHTTPPARAVAALNAVQPKSSKQRKACSFLKKRTKKLLSVRFRARSISGASGGQSARAKVF
jgi:hypothetical protein